MNWACTALSHLHSHVYLHLHLHLDLHLHLHWPTPHYIALFHLWLFCQTSFMSKAVPLVWSRVKLKATSGMVEKYE